MSLADQSIGVFDSGMGGLTVVKALTQVLPNENIIYFGDTARLPYGNKSAETIIRYSKEIAWHLKESDVKIIVIACNTASAYALEALQSELDIPVIGVIKPSALRAVEESPSGRIAVLGTRATINSDAYKREILAIQPDADITQIACPLFVSLAEEGFVNHPATKLIISEYLRAILVNAPDTLLLGCTHYPLLVPALREFIGQRIHIVDSATSCAEAVKSLLHNERLLSSSSSPGTYRFIVSDSPDTFRLNGEKFLGMPLDVSEMCVLQEASTS